MAHGTSRNAASGLALVACCFLFLSTPFARAQSPQEVAQQVHAEGGYSDEVAYPTQSGSTENFPFRGGNGSGEEDERLSASGSESGISGYERGVDANTEPLEERSPGMVFPEVPRILGKVFRILLIVLAALGVLALLYVIVRTLQGMERGTIKDEAVPLPASAPTGAALPWNPGDPDKLAAEGRFHEAIVALLVRALKASGWREHERGRTAREVLAALTSADARRPPLTDVVGLAEGVRFAGQTADRTLFERVKAIVLQITGSVA